MGLFYFILFFWFGIVYHPHKNTLHTASSSKKKEQKFLIKKKSLIHTREFTFDYENNDGSRSVKWLYKNTTGKSLDD